MRYIKGISLLSLILLFGVIYGMIRTSGYEYVVPEKEMKKETMIITKTAENQDPNGLSAAANEFNHLVTKTFASLLKGLE